MFPFDSEMELGLTLGESSSARPPACTAAQKTAHNMLGLGFFMGLGIGLGCQEDQEICSAHPPVQLELLRPRSPPPHLGLPWMHETRNPEAATCNGFDVNRAPWVDEPEEAGASPGSTVSSLQIMGGERDGERGDRESSRPPSDDEENGLSARKKLRLSKEQSAFLEESFKEHNTLNPKQKAALANQLGLRPRQVEVWFQNRRARTKLKQTEVDCEYLKRCCETLTEENRRLRKELGDLRALKTATPFYMQLPATTLSMCPSCERVSSANSAAPAGGDHNKPGSFAALLARPRFFPSAAS